MGREEDGLARGLQSALKQSGHFRGAKPRVRLPDMIGLFNDIFSHSAILSSLYPIYQYFLTQICFSEIVSIKISFYVRNKESGPSDVSRNQLNLWALLYQLISENWNLELER